MKRAWIVLGTFVLSFPLVAACGGGSTSTPTAPTPAPAPSITTPTCAFSFSPARVEVSSSPQRVTIQVITGSSCRWTATSSDRWISVVRSGSLYQTGNGSATLDLTGNVDQCPTSARTGRVNITDEAARVQANFEVHQGGAGSSFRPPTACSVNPIAYGASIRGSLISSDCTTSYGSKAKYHTFQGFAGQETNILMTAGGLISGGVPSPLLRLLGPTGGLVAGSGGGPGDITPVIDRRLSCGGTYTIEVSSGNPNGRGDYFLQLRSKN